MAAKVLVLYPHPVEPAAFERSYHEQHMPMMRSMISPPSRVPTYRVEGGSSAPFYRVAEIHFDDLEQLRAFGASPDAEVARRSSRLNSTGGEPIVLVCLADDP